MNMTLYISEPYIDDHVPIYFLELVSLVGN